MGDSVYISDDEVRRELYKQGYADLPAELFQQFKKDLQNSIRDAVNRGVGVNTSTPLVSGGRSLSVSSRANCSSIDRSEPKRTTRLQPHDNSSTCYSTPCASQSETSQSKTMQASAIRTLPNDPDHSGSKSSCYSTPVGNASGNEVSAASASSSNSIVGEPRVMHRKVLRCRNGHAYISEHSTISADSSGLCQNITFPFPRRKRYWVCSSSGADEHKIFENQSHFFRPIVSSSCALLFVNSWPRVPESATGLHPSFKENSSLYRALPRTAVKPPPEAVQGQPILKDTLQPWRASILSLLQSSGNKVEWELGRGKCDPVTRYHEYRAAWERHRAPGEKAHKQLRWNVRAQMMRRDDVVTDSWRPRVGK
ncbi:unnamed protein product [Ixodes persulcatus]